MNEIEIEQFWNFKHPHVPIIYNGRAIPNRNGIIPIDVRKMFWTEDYMLTDIIEKNNLIGLSNDETAWLCQKYIVGNYQYVFDSDNVKYNEYWQMPNETLFLRVGDCEDGSLLMGSLMASSGIPVWRIRVNAGWVLDKSGKQTGHAYVTYCREIDNNWAICDWCIVDNSETFVNTPCGRKRFPNLKVGDFVIGFNETSKKIEKTQIIKIGNREVDDVYIIDYRTPGTNYNKHVLCTPEHPWSMGGEWTQTKDLQIGDHIDFVSGYSLSNMFMRKDQYERTSVRQTNNNIFCRDDVRKKLSINNCMKDPKMVEKVYSERLKQDHLTVPEKDFILLCKENEFPVRFVGHGDYWVDGKNPDFKVNGMKKIIEVTNYGFLKRDEKWAKNRADFFEKRGHKALIVFYPSHKHEPMVSIDSIRNFIFNGAEIINIRKARKDRKTVWNLHCEPHNNYFVNGLLSHNCYNEDSKICIAEKPLAKDRQEYKEIWFSFNSQYSWSLKQYDLFKSIDCEPKVLFDD